MQKEKTCLNALLKNVNFNKIFIGKEQIDMVGQARKLISTLKKDHVFDVDQRLYNENLQCLIKNIITDPVKKDFVQRTVAGIGKLNANDGKEKGFDKVLEEFSKYLFKELESLASRAISNQNQFNSWHQKLCKKFLDIFDELQNNVKLKIKYGKAQKVVNMFFKYFCCLYKGNEYDYIYEYCHMPLDSYILNWVKYVICNNKSESSKEIKEIIKNISWSNLELEQYEKIQNVIREYFNNLEDENLWIKNPFLAEFYIWREEQLYETLIKYELSGYSWNKRINAGINKMNEIIQDLKSELKKYKGCRREKTGGKNDRKDIF